MYNFLLIFIIRALTKVKAVDINDGAVTLLCFIIFSHILLVLLWLKHLDMFNLSDYVNSNASKYIYLPVVVPFMIFIFWWFNKKRVERIVERYKDRKVLTLVNTLLFIVLGILPFSAFLYLLS